MTEFEVRNPSTTALRAGYGAGRAAFGEGAQLCVFPTQHSSVAPRFVNALHPRAETL